VRPPRSECFSSTRTRRLLTLARMVAAVRPPMPDPMTMASHFCGVEEDGMAVTVIAA